MKRLTIIIVMCTAFFSTAWSEKPALNKVAILDSVMKPSSLHIFQGRAYITEKTGITIISLKTGKQIGKFGQPGEGPGEFKGTPTLRVFPDCLIVNSRGKVIFFDHDGRFVREKKHQFGHPVGAIPLGEKYVGQKSNFSEKEQTVVQNFGIYDDSFDLLKELFKSPNPNEMDILPGDQKQPYPVIHDTISLDIYNGHIFIADSRKGFFFKVFDGNGSWLTDIQVNLPARPVEADFKKKMLKSLESEPWWNRLKDRLKPVFPKYFPEIRFFSVRDKKIYVQTFIEEKDKCLFRIYDISNKKLTEIYLPQAHQKTTKLYDIRDGRYYYLELNEESDVWELFGTNI